jgi:hypothetical protein
MRQLPPGGLVASPALMQSEPAAIVRWGVACHAAADALGGAAGRLDGMCAALPSGLWLSPAAAEFGNAAREQSRRMRVIAGLFSELGRVAETLSVALASAREQALAAVARSRQVDADVEDFNARTRAQHALLPQDPDSLLVSEPEAQDLLMRLAGAAGELAGAEAAARRAWQRAAADFDVVGYGTPAMRERMAAAPWDPAGQVRLAASGAAGVISCGPMEALGLPAGGKLIGPDGRSYPLLVQTALASDGTLLVTTREPAGTGGWRALAVREGTTAYGRRAAAWEKVAVALGGAAGAAYPEGSTFAPDLLGRVQIMGGGGAYLGDQPRAPIDAVKEASAEPLRGDEVNSYWVAPQTGWVAGRRAAVPDAIGLIDGALAGYLLARHLDDGRAADYRVVFEENAEGSLRARMQLFRVLEVPGEKPRTVTEGGYVDASGHLAGIPATGEAPGTTPIMIAAPK